MIRNLDLLMETRSWIRMAPHQSSQRIPARREAANNGRRVGSILHDQGAGNRPAPSPVRRDFERTGSRLVMTGRHLIRVRGIEVVGETPCRKGIDRFLSLAIRGHANDVITMRTRQLHGDTFRGLHLRQTNGGGVHRLGGISPKLGPRARVGNRKRRIYFNAIQEWHFDGLPAGRTRIQNQNFPAAASQW